MSYLALQYPVFTLHNRLLLPAGVKLTPETMETLIPIGCGSQVQTYNILKYSTIKNDLFNFINRIPQYRIIFACRKRTDILIKLMDSVHLPTPVLFSLEYFKRYDFYTYRHILMVFALSTLLAQELIKDRQLLVQQIIAGPTHDFGKICVPLSILKKATPLTSAEMKMLKHHTVAGHVLLSYYYQDTNNFAAKVARDHHERADGSGYPAGTCLKDPMVEIIIASDIYDALISPRPYRSRAYDNRTALEELTDLAYKGELSMDVVKALIAHNRKDRPHYSKCVLSKEKRGTPPSANLHGVISDKNS
ncbi:MAG: HD domain-containing protein [Desulfobacteraceae bacterium]|nr:HD domain-containing protein [Desulfobacteraceae bacterium]